MTKKELKDFKQRIIETKEDAEVGIDECEENDSLIYQGWSEALDYVLNDKILRRIK
jgi:hypothetical protein